MNQPLVSIIILNWKQAQLTIECVHSVKNITYRNYEIIVVDNGSGDGSAERIKKAHPDIQIIQLPENTGYAKGNNEGMKNARGEFFLILNNDILVAPNFLEPLLAQAQSDPKAGAVSPKILSVENPALAEYSGFSSVHPITGRGRMRQGKAGENNSAEATGIIHGAAFLVSRKVAELTGFFYEDFFLYYEELDWSYRIKAYGFKNYYVGESKVYHYGSMSGGKDSVQKTFWLNRNRIIFMRRNFPQYLLFFYFYLFLISMPVNMLKFIIKFRPVQLQTYLRGVFCGVVKKNVRRVSERDQ